jgi:hypothetical protein
MEYFLSCFNISLYHLLCLCLGFQAHSLQGSYFMWWAPHILPRVSVGLVWGKQDVFGFKLVRAAGVLPAVYKIIGTEKLSNVVSEKNFRKHEGSRKKHTCLVAVRLGTNHSGCPFRRTDQGHSTWCLVCTEIQAFENCACLVNPSSTLVWFCKAWFWVCLSWSFVLWS